MGQDQSTFCLCSLLDTGPGGTFRIAKEVAYRGKVWLDTGYDGIEL